MTGSLVQGSCLFLFIEEHHCQTCKNIDNLWNFHTRIEITSILTQSSLDREKSYHIETNQDWYLK